MERRPLEIREKLGPTGAKPKGPNSLEQSLYGMKKETTSGSIPEFLDSATEEQEAEYQGTLARSTAAPDGPGYWLPSHSNSIEWSERKGGGCFSTPEKRQQSKERQQIRETWSQLKEEATAQEKMAERLRKEQWRRYKR